jgi:uroporphyrinogen decarboxylase
LKSIERVAAAVAFEKPDRAPVIAQVFGHAAVFSGVPLRDYLQSGELLARCQLKALEFYGYDAVFALMDANVETEAAGSRLQYSDEAYPHINSYALSSGASIDTCSVPDPTKSGRMPEQLKAVSILRREVGDEVLVVGCALGPATLANQLYGAEAALFLSVDDPETYCRLLDFATEICVSFGTAQIEAGAHLPILFDPAASPAVVPSAFYHKFVLPRHKRVFSAFKQAGAIANWLHVAGRVCSILPYYTEAGANIANFDFNVSPDEAQALLPHTCLDGNIKSLSFVEDEPEQITAESLRLIDTFRERGGYILSSGCEIPPESKPENIKAMVEAARP